MSDTATAKMQTITYDDEIVRKFTWASILWGIVALLLGVYIALELAFWQANIPPYFNFGRLRPLHTNAAIFAFVGNMMFAGIYYSTQRLTKARPLSNFLSQFHFWGWQLIIVSAAITLPLGFTQGKEYAELEWPIDIAIAVIWVAFAINFFGMLANRREKQLYVAIWFYIATICTVAVLHIVNNISIPVGWFKSYSIYGGAQDALVQWWYGHNAVAFVLTTPILGIMYYFLPKAAGRPVYSYRLSIVHFWALVFVYIWAGPHHLLNTALPDWTQTLGMVFSLMLWAPSWGGMLNGLLTLRGAWNQVREDPVLKFLAAGVTFYGMATFEGPLLAIRGVSSLAHYTDWVIGHVHGGTLGWNGLMAFGMFYWLVPRLYGTKLHSKKMADLHFYIATIGILTYMIAMWVSGITQGMMWRATDENGDLLYKSFVETLIAIKPMYWMRLIGGLLYFAGIIMMTWNLVVTARKGAAVNGQVEVAVEQAPAKAVTGWQIIFGAPVLLTAITLALLGLVAVTTSVSAGAVMILAAAVGFGGVIVMQLSRDRKKPTWHSMLEGHGLYFTVFTVIAVLIGGAAEIIPSLIIGKSINHAVYGQKPYRALELEGRDIYIREGCYLCHSQMIRPFVWEKMRYAGTGEVSHIEDSRYDHPFQWGSKRTGPDLAREGIQRASASWHWKHMINPRITPGSIMPSYEFMSHTPVDLSRIEDKLRAMRAVGVPYTPEQIASADADARLQLGEVKTLLANEGVKVDGDPELLALISFLRRLGVDTNSPPPTEAPISMKE